MYVKKTFVYTRMFSIIIRTCAARSTRSHLCKAIKVHMLMFLSLGSIRKPAAVPPAVLSAYMAEFFYVIPFDLLSIVLCNKSNKIISDI